ncbi:MAG TPA: triphosphoribosyl-dephospho-CoA synthase [Methylophilaceae bacterium]|nr:triphosphoribosyl-dephospho-CoA synthase [Methylophilaceae bacterium]
MSDAQRLALLFKQACLAEIEALKPGNVHIFADGHGMTVEDFIHSAEAACLPLAASGRGVGERVRDAQDATWAVVGCNTNLGILLLCAPLLKAAESLFGAGLQPALQQVLAALTVEDAELAFRAIVRASPAGLGTAATEDVHAPARVTLLQAMQVAQDRDRIAMQYVSGFADVFSAAGFYEEVLARWQRPAWATTAVYLRFLATFEDSHLARKFGGGIAAEVRAEGQAHFQAFISLDNPKTYLPELLRFDASLKARGLNPGTSADLTVAAVLCSLLRQP